MTVHNLVQLFDKEIYESNYDLHILIYLMSECREHQMTVHIMVQLFDKEIYESNNDLHI